MDVAGIKIPGFINDHTTLLRISKSLQALITNGLGSARGLIRKLIGALVTIHHVLVQVTKMPDRLGPNIGDTVRQQVQDQADVAARVNTRVLAAIEQLQQMERALVPMGEAAATTAKKTQTAIGA